MLDSEQMKMKYLNVSEEAYVNTYVDKFIKIYIRLLHGGGDVFMRDPIFLYEWRIFVQYYSKVFKTIIR